MKLLCQFFLALLLMLTMSSHAQISNNSWALSLGFNVVDTRPTAGGSSSFLNNTFSQPLNVKEYWNVHPSALYLKIARSAGNNFTFDLQGSYNKIGKLVTYNPNASAQNGEEYIVTNPGDLKYYGIDGSVKYSLMNLITSKVIDPSLHVGGGYTYWGNTSFNTVNGGGGLTFWFSRNIGLAFDTTFKKAFGEKTRSHVLHTAGITYKFGGCMSNS